jgi:dTMP kinase
MKKNTFEGKFIVFEGLDGSGQSTQAGLLREFLMEKGFNVILTKEPTLDSEAGKRIRKVLDKEIKVSPKELQELMVKDRKEHLERVIIPALKDGIIVISDRYFLSTLAFGSADGLDLEWLIEINNQFLYPDTVFLLRVSPPVCIERIKNRGGSVDLFEKEEKLSEVWKAYKILPDKFENIFVIDGEKSIEKVFEKVKEIIIKQLNL